jgi:pentatricopeptide repeat protein
LQLLPVLADHGVQADAHLYNSLMKAHIATSDPAGVLVVLRRMKVDGTDPDLITYNNLIYGLTRAGLRAGMVAKAGPTSTPWPRTASSRTSSTPPS